MSERPYQVKGINHLGIAPADPERFVTLLEALGLQHLVDETVDAQKVTTRIFRFTSNSDNLLEVLQPSLPDSGAIASYLQKKGSGIHHIAITVDNLLAAMADLKAKGFQFTKETPDAGVCQTSIAFLHPRSTGGILVELVQNP